jgi:hypothetical protein
MASGWREDWARPQFDQARSVSRRWTALAVIVAIALAGAILGQMSVVRDDIARPVPPGPLGRAPL